MPRERAVAYFSMEIGLRPEVPTYAGGLGLLAGDTLRSAADEGVPLVGVSLLHRRGYFFQRIDASGRQSEEPVHWPVEDYLRAEAARAEVEIEGRRVAVAAWSYEVRGVAGGSVPVHLLDTDLPENDERDRRITDFLYGGDERHRLCQEIVLGIGGVRVLRALGHRRLERFHMNEGHAAFLTLELLREERERAGRDHLKPEDLEAVRRCCVFTTHTPVPAGHDKFDLGLVRSVLGQAHLCSLSDEICHEGRLNMTYLALILSHYVNGVAKRHGELSRHMFGGYAIEAITNGVHAATWVSPPFAELFDRHIPGWREDNYSLRYALSFPDAEVREAHWQAKRTLVDYANRTANAGFDREGLTLGYARRATAYKRPMLIFEDLERLRRIARDRGPLQLVFAGKAHPRDDAGKELIRQVIQAGRSLAPDVACVWLPNYGMELARVMTAGVDVWLNTPEPPNEASGTSGMKSALNGVPSLSILDGWWIEGCIEGLTGWAIGTDGRDPQAAPDRKRDAESLYEKLEGKVVPMFYEQPERFGEVMRHAIALNGSFFNTQRMIQQYVVDAYFL